ncbi:hypothetical protein CASFOL_000734 [Castilleja foliolosa]|uniref:C3H1-type domain-containing protein n=1 Tax=Castilleja foliolosa TaxID=1961234 RepID=A0ABD3EKV4_9LAMI
MAEVQPSSTSEKPQTEKLGLGLLIDNTTSQNPITLTGSNPENQHTEPSNNAPDGKSDSPAMVMAAEVEDSGATDEDVEFQISLERDFCRLTIEQSEIESVRERSEAIDVKELKDIEGTENAASVEDENQNGLGDVENERTVKLDNLCVDKGGKIADSVENENRWGYMENEETRQLDNLHEEKGDEIVVCVENENRWGYMENEKPVKLDNVHEEKGGGIFFESVENENENRWGYMENEETVKLGYDCEEKGGKNVQSIENENRWGYIENEKSVRLYNGYDDKGGGNAENVEDENENGLGFMENAGGAATRVGRYNNQSNNNKRVSYPMRPDAENCAFYMRSGSCKFGSTCKFNHPPRRKNQGVKERSNFNEENSERAGQTECKYYLTPGGCKYGKDCKFSHGSDLSSNLSYSVEFNFLGLPIRPGEKECPYYMRTGTCKYGTSCRFHHPEPTSVGGADSPSGYGNDGSIPSQLVSSSVSSRSSPRAFNETSSLTPVLFSQAQGAPTSDSDWNSYQAATYPTSERSLPMPPAFALNNLLTDINIPMQHQHDMGLEEYPERPGAPVCVFFIKTGDCKFKSNCKFHHPKTHNSNARTDFSLSDKGLPLRPGQPICTHYNCYGICKYGPSCKYDHPSNYGNFPTISDGPPFSNSNVLGGES